MQFVKRHLIGFDVIPDLLGTPVGERVEFYERVIRGRKGRVNLNLGEVFTGSTLVLPLPGYPGIDRAEFTP
jgi:hypothetical protein